MPDVNVFDAVIVGGGPAGLTASIYLSRFRRSVALIDAGDSRAALIPLSHNYPGFPEGISGRELLARMHGQAEHYAVHSLHGKVVSIDRTDIGFSVSWRRISDDTSRVCMARLVLLCSGVADVEPPFPHVHAAVKRGTARYCPVCDAYEVSAKRIAILAGGTAGLHEALYLRHYSDKVTLVPTNADIAFTDNDVRRMDEAGVELLSRAQDDIRIDAEGRVEIDAGGTTRGFDTIYCAMGTRVNAALATALGARTDSDGYVAVDAHQRTSVTGLYAAGDVATGLNQIAVSVGQAAIAASAMHLALRG